jgi:chromosome segregation ATPase
MYDPQRSTQVYKDRLAASKKLADENASMSVEHERLKLEIQGLREVKEDIVRKSGYTPDEYKKVEKEHFARIEGIENQIVEAKIELGRLQESVEDRRASLKVMSPQMQDLEKKIGVLESDLEVLVQRRADAESSARLAEGKYSELITRKSSELALLMDKVNAKQNAHLVMTQELEKRLASVVEQERALSIRRTDLEIYEARLRAKYPRDPIIL